MQGLQSIQVGIAAINYKLEVCTYLMQPYTYIAHQELNGMNLYDKIAATLYKRDLPVLKRLASIYADNGLPHLCKRPIRNMTSDAYMSLFQLCCLFSTASAPSAVDPLTRWGSCGWSPVRGLRHTGQLFLSFSHLYGKLVLCSQTT